MSNEPIHVLASDLTEEEHAEVALALSERYAKKLGLTLEEYHSATLEQIRQLQESKFGKPIVLTEEEWNLI